MLANTHVTDKTQLKVGDRVTVMYNGHSISDDFKIASKVSKVCNATLVDTYGTLSIELDDKLIEKYSSGKLKNFSKGQDGAACVGASWGGTTVNGRFLTSGCKIIGLL